MAEYNEEILDHEYDGIQEMHNNLPRWWLYMFDFTMIIQCSQWAIIGPTQWVNYKRVTSSKPRLELYNAAC